MKILMVDKYYFIKGGAERYFFELAKILSAKGHEVVPFSMKHHQNFPTPYEKYFVENIEYDFSGALDKVRKSFQILGRMVYSFHAQKCLEKLISNWRPDIAHLHMIDHQISPSILHTLRKYNIPVIQTVHQYKLACPNYRFYNMRKQQICEKCANGNYFHPIFERCHKDSMLAGAMLSVETYIHKAIKIYEKNIDIFHVPSQFMGEKIRQAGIDKKKIRHLFYTIEIDEYPPYYGNDGYFVYYGRLAREKGIMTLLRAMKQIEKSKLFIIGEGPERKPLQDYALENNLENVSFLGKKGGEDLKKLVSHSQFVVVPSEWYDNSPLVIYESFSMGKPVIGAAIGGISELVDDGINGYQFQPGNAVDLAEKINLLLSDRLLLDKFGKNARQKAEKEFAPEQHYQKIMAKYEELLNGK